MGFKSSNAWVEALVAPWAEELYEGIKTIPQDQQFDYEVSGMLKPEALEQIKAESLFRLKAYRGDWELSGKLVVEYAIDCEATTYQVIPKIRPHIVQAISGKSKLFYAELESLGCCHLEWKYLYPRLDSPSLVAVAEKWIEHCYAHQASRHTYDYTFMTLIVPAMIKALKESDKTLTQSEFNAELDL